MTRQPNILLISTDQHRADYLSCYGANVLHTPNIDRLSEQGIRCEKAYVASPICMPNRASLITGRMPSAHRLRHNGLNLPLDSTTIPEVLRRSGWRTSLVGKAHFQCLASRPAFFGRDVNGRKEVSRLEARLQEVGDYEQENLQRWKDNPEHDLVYPYYGFESVSLAIGHGDQVEGHYARWLARQHGDSASLIGPKNALPGCGRTAPQAWRTALPEELYPTRYVEQETIQKLGEYSEQPETPFLLWASFCDPHHPFTPPGRYWDMYDPEAVEVPATFAASTKPHLAANVHRQRQMGTANLSGTAAIAVNEEELRAAIALTYGLITMVDDAVGAILSALEQSPFAENTIVVFFSDHGDLMGEHGLLFKGPFHYQPLVRMPLIWSDRRHRGARVHRSLISAIDLPATILEAAQVEHFNGLQGTPFVSATGELLEARNCVLIEDEIQTNLPGHDVRGRTRTLITDRWRLTIHDGVASGELYDLISDPHETENLWNHSSAGGVRAELTERLVRQMIAQSETSPLPEYAA
ncbi:MAG: sulfatase-like hydrolase/transferase [Rhodospirillales bacterium]|nr:sulfatase-like hydrolase/transferase [Rhodospirillales bacterium]